MNASLESLLCTVETCNTTLAVCVLIQSALLMFWALRNLWLLRKRKEAQQRNLIARHARIKAGHSGCITPELLQVLTGIATLLLLGLAMAACFADDPTAFW